jgi:hypothetical protein
MTLNFVHAQKHKTSYLSNFPAEAFSYASNLQLRRARIRNTFIHATVHACPCARLRDRILHVRRAGTVPAAGNEVQSGALTAIVPGNGVNGTHRLWLAGIIWGSVNYPDKCVCV